VNYNSPDNGWEVGKKVLVNDFNEIYVCGDGDNLKIIVIKYDIMGNQQWVLNYKYQDNYTTNLTSATTDEDGNLYICGKTYVSLSRWDYLTIKVNSNGEIQWIETYNGTGDMNDGANDIVVSPNGNVYVTGTSYGNNTMTDYATIKYSQCYATSQLKSSTSGILVSHDEFETQENDNRVQKKQNATACTLYPNPNDGNMELDYYFSSGRDGKIVIRNVQGMTISQYPLMAVSRHAKINSGMLSNGIYIFSIFEGDIIVSQGKLVVVKY
ncbi:MAG: T9SS type A sorting domain-containing protein, partial [Bacteroidetes bacterium]|nr:T9SS type A sorting domain-containing protein [Bacteroidota bacterium]